MLFDSLGMHANTPRNCSCCFFSISVHITCCMTSTNPYGTACSSLLSEIRTSLCFGMRSLLRQMLSLFSAQPLSCSLLFSQQECCNFLVLGISPRTSWHLTKNLLLSQQDCCCFFFSCSWHLTKISSTSSYPCSWHLTKSLLASHQDFFCFILAQEWVRPLALINLMREGEEFSNLTVEIRSDGWLRFGVSSLTLTLIIKLSFNLHLTN
jgi:hypothetical protein